MIDLLERFDPARGRETDMARLRHMVDERIGISAPIRPLPRQVRRPWLIAIAAFAIVLVVAVPALLLQEDPSVFTPQPGATGDLPGVGAVVPLASGGVQTAVVDGDTIWVLTSLAHKLQEISAISGKVEATYPIEAYAEGVVVGGGYLWMFSYDNGGEVLRFDPAAGTVDVAIPLDGLPGGAHWFTDSLWVSNDQGQLHQITPTGDIISTSPGELKGTGLGYLWVNDPDTGLITSVAGDGTRGEIVIPTHSGLETSDGWGVRSVTEAGGYLWLMDDAFPWGTNLSRFDPDTGELSSFEGLTFGLLGMTEFDGSLWVTSNTDHLLIRVDPESGEVTRFPMPGKAGGVFAADDSLWVTLYHPGVLARLDPSVEMIAAGEVVADDWDRFPHRLICTGSDEAGGPTVLLEPTDWIDYGSWSVIQARLSGEGYLVCANGYVEGEATPQQRAADLGEALIEAGIPGPYVLVANGDGVHAIRTFADGRDDIAGVVLVDPIPLGFSDFLDTSLEALVDGGGHPIWLDLDPAVSASLGDFGSRPLVVIGQDPDAVYLNPGFVEWAGQERAERINDFWQEGLAFYAGLSADSTSVSARGTGFERILWDEPDLVIEQVLNVLGPTTPG